MDATLERPDPRASRTTPGSPAGRPSHVRRRADPTGRAARPPRGPGRGWIACRPSPRSSPPGQLGGRAEQGSSPWRRPRTVRQRRSRRRRHSRSWSWRLSVSLAFAFAAGLRASDVPSARASALGVPVATKGRVRGERGTANMHRVATYLVLNFAVLEAHFLQAPADGGAGKNAAKGRTRRGRAGVLSSAR